MPANEHLTIQIAKQIFGIKTAENAMINFQNGESAYIVKRFDLYNGKSLAQEDFCQLLQISEETNGKNYKYDFSYEKAVDVIRKYSVTSKIEIERYYYIILFNYLFSNGDAHLKNFSLIQTIDKDYILSPAYDLLCTSIHFRNEPRLALDLFEDYETESFLTNGFYKKSDFLYLAKIFGISESRAISYIDTFYMRKNSSMDMIKRSFLSKEAKERYLSLFEDRLLAIKN